MKALLPLLLLASVAIADDHPSRAPVKGCKWEKASSATLGLEAWVQRCDFGFRKIDLFIKGSSLFVHYSDGGAPDPVVDVLPLLPNETAESGIKRIFASHTNAKLAKRCVLAPYPGDVRPGAKRYTFIPDRAYKKELDAKADPNEVGDPPAAIGATHRMGFSISRCRAPRGKCCSCALGRMSRCLMRRRWGSSVINYEGVDCEVAERLQKVARGDKRSEHPWFTGISKRIVPRQRHWKTTDIFRCR